MSYILDALRKADAQRVRDPARGIHALPAGPSPVRPGGGRRGEQALWGAAILVLCIAAGLWFARDEAPAPAVSSAPTVSPAMPPGAAVPNHSPPPRVSTPATVVLPPAPPSLPVTALPRQAPVAPAGPAAASPLSAPVAPAAVEGAPKAVGQAGGQAGRQPPAAAAARAPASASPPATDRVYNFADLPADVQQAFPKLAISGGVYSANLAQRMLIVNGQVFNEGSELAPGVVLEQMRPKSAVLRFRGLRVAQPY